MITVSLCMIVKNEEDILAHCLDSLKGLMDEIIIVDTGRLTVQKRSQQIILTKYMIFHGARILRLPGIFLFPKLQKNIFIQPDADEVLDEITGDVL